MHDGVLQVLALVQRRGAELGGEAAELGRLAGEQEVALRSLIQDRRTPLAPAPPVGARSTWRGAGDRLQARTRPRSRSRSRAAPVPVPGAVAEIVAVVRACLHNVADHVGERRPAWVLLEDLGDEVVVSVRDDGPGIAGGRLDEAAAEGRLGVTESIRGRVAGLGGTADADHRAGPGTEWEFTIPRKGATMTDETAGDPGDGGRRPPDVARRCRPRPREAGLRGGRHGRRRAPRRWPRFARGARPEVVVLDLQLPAPPASR